MWTFYCKNEVKHVSQECQISPDHKLCDNLPDLDVSLYMYCIYITFCPFFFTNKMIFWGQNKYKY